MPNNPAFRWASTLVPGAALLAAGFGWPASAAQITVRAEPHPAPVMIFLEGEIVPGDLNRLTLILDEFSKETPTRDITLALSSPGGDHFIGLRIALLLRRTGVGTVVRPHKICSSACTSILFGGYDLKAGKPNRVVYQSAWIAVHRWRIYSHRSVSEYDERRVANAAERFFNEMEISSHIQQRIFETHPYDLYILSVGELEASGFTVRSDD